MARAAGAGDLPRLVEQHTGYGVEIAVDLGTSGTGWALVWRPKAGTEDPTGIVVHPYAPGEGSGAAASISKALTAVLLNAKDDEVIAVGRRARERFRTAFEKGDGSEKGLHYFERFKMNLASGSRSGKKPSEITITASGSGAQKPLLLPFVKLLEFIKREAMERVRNTDKTIKDSEIGWVVTVPAIWDDEAKGFMRKAAFKAGLIDQEDSPRLLLVLEPEAAAVAAILGAPEAVRKQFTPGHKLIVVDAGGGTVDITVSEVAATNPIELRELLPASGGPWGGTATDARLVEFIVRELMPTVASHMSIASKTELLDAWEAAKVGYQLAYDSSSSSSSSSSSAAAGSSSSSASSSSDGSYHLRMGAVLDFLPEKDPQGKDIDGYSALKAGIDSFNAKRNASKHAGLSINRQKVLDIPASLVHERIMDPVIDKTVEHVQTLLQDPKARDCKTLLLVGGFAESSYLQKRIRDAFDTSSRSVLIAVQPGFAVNRGAALFGCFPSSFVSQRILRFSYGVVTTYEFDDGKHHTLTRRVYDDGEARADNLLRLIAKRGRSVKTNETISAGGFFPISAASTRVTFPIWRTELEVSDDHRTNPYFLLKPGWAEAGIKGIPESCKCGEVSVNCFNPNDEKQKEIKREDRTIEVELLFGRTEIVVKTTAKLTGATEFTRLKYE